MLLTNSSTGCGITLGTATTMYDGETYSWKRTLRGCKSSFHQPWLFSWKSEILSDSFLLNSLLFPWIPFISITLPTLWQLHDINHFQLWCMSSVWHLSVNSLQLLNFSKTNSFLWEVLSRPPTWSSLFASPVWAISSPARTTMKSFLQTDLISKEVLQL